MPLVKRNEVELEFNQAEVKRGPNMGSKFYATKVTKDNLQNVITWIGLDETTAMLNALMRLRSKGWSQEAQANEGVKNEDGSINEEKYDLAFTSMAQEFSARGESIKDLELQQAELVDELTSLDYAEPDSISRAKEISSEIKKIQLAIQGKRRKSSDEEEPAPATA